MRTIIDGHLDLAWNAASFDRDLTASLDQLRANERLMNDMKCRGRATTSFPELRRGGVRLCIATLLARSGPATDRQAGYKRTDLDFAHPIGAYAAAHAQLACYHLWQRQGWIEWIRNLDDLERHWNRCRNSDVDDVPLGMILSMEGLIQ
ncbi:MAG: hypothetical protein R3C05_03505 [Pirellulaceae bacterium]